MKVVTAVVNNPVFIQIQYYTLQKYMKCDYEFIVFNDAKPFHDYSNGRDINIKYSIEEMCRKLNIQCINIPNLHHIKQQDASIRTADSMNFILEYQKRNPDKYLLLDSDMFLVDNFELSDYEKYDCSVVLQSRFDNKIKYFWNGLYYFDINKMNNLSLLNWNCFPSSDTGGMMQLWLLTQDIQDKNSLNNKSNIYYIEHLSSCSWNENEIPENLKDNAKLIHFIKTDPRNQNDKFFCEIYDNKFLHYRAGGNWEKRNMNIHVALTLKLRELLLN
jgi:hypothetical protein